MAGWNKDPTSIHLSRSTLGSTKQSNCLPRSRMPEMFWSRLITSQSWSRSSTKFSSSAINSVLNKEDPMSDELLRASEAARRLDISTKDLLGLVHGRKIRYVMVDGIAHVPVEALDEFRAKAS